ncbi:CAP domain-containing protein [Oceanithermus desulfurans]|nr:CAP domain-containing protein [Oceanithermus desulfurans]MBB6029180.1 uncharacterized protein YkwD [Oceanithermus desulfurans]
MRRALAFLPLLLVLAACSQPKPLAPELVELLERINQVRAAGVTCHKDGADNDMPPVGPLRANTQLNWAAQRHAEDMDAADQLSHTTPVGAVHFGPGTDPGERIAQSGYLAAAWGENIAWGYTTAEEVLNGWLASTAGHCEGLMNGNYQDAGLGRSGNYWVLDMARPQ